MKNNAIKECLIRFYPWAIIILSSITLVYKYIMQVSPSVMTNQLMRAFHLYGTGLGNLAATFFYSYLVIQIFAGYLLDKFSIRLLTSIAIAISAIGTFLFAGAHNLTTALFARALMGVGPAFFTVSFMKLASNWFPPNRFAFISGLLATAATVGAIFGQAPLAWMVIHHDWRFALIIIAFLGTVLTIFYFLVVTDHPHGKKAIATRSAITLRDAAKILFKGQNWVLTFYSGLAFAPLAVFSGFWATPFIREAYHRSLTEAASYASISFLGLAIGGPLLGHISDRIGNRRSIMFLGAILSLISLTIIIYVNTTPIWLLCIFLFLFGFGTGAFMLGFVVGKEINPLALAATVIAVINTGDAVFGAFTEPLIGKFLDETWQGKIIAGTHYFGIPSFHKAFSLLPCYLIVAILLVFFVKERKCGT